MRKRTSQNLIPCLLTGWLGAALSVMIALGTFGCGKQQPAQRGAPVSDNKSLKSSTADLFTIRYRPKWLHQAQFAGVYMAKEKGFYTSRGLNVEIQPGGLTHPSYEALISGETDITDQFLIYALTQNEIGPPLVNLAQISQKNSTRLLGKKSSGITKLEDLKGKKVGIWRNESGELVKLMLEDRNLDVDVVTVDWSVNLLLNNAVDMMNVMTYNEYHRVLMAGLDANELVTFNLNDYGYGLVEEGLYTTSEFYNRHTKQCQDFAAATIEGWIYAFAHREETLDVVLRYMRERFLPANRGHQAWMLDHMSENVLEDPNAVGYLKPEDLETAQTILLKHGWISRRNDYQTFAPYAIKQKP